MTVRPLTPKQRRHARHALGLPNTRNRSYRNRFVCPYAPGVYDDWVAMCDAGLAEAAPIVGNQRRCWLTRAAAEAALEPGETLDREDFPE